MERAAHALKGSVGYVKAQRTAEAAKQLEMIGASGDLSGAVDAVQTLEREVKRLTAALAAPLTVACN